MIRASQSLALAVLIVFGLAALAGCSEKVELVPSDLVVGAFPTTIPPSSETLLTVSVKRDCAAALGGVCTVCGSLFPANPDGGGDDGALYDPVNPAVGAARSVKIATSGGESDLVYRGPATPGLRVVSFLLFDGAVGCDGSATPVAAASVRIEISGDGEVATTSADAGAEESTTGGER